MPTRHWLLLIVFTLSLFTIKLGSERTLTIHEAHFAEVAREMLATGDWVVPRIAGEPWLEKPPLPHWIMAPSIWLFGRTSELAVRLPSAILGLLGVLIIALLAAHWYGPTHGLLTGLIQATTVYTTTYARLAEGDVYLWLPCVACLAIFAMHHVKPVVAVSRWYCGPAMFLFLLGLTQMAKGPLFGVVLVMLPCVGFLILERRWSAWRWFLSWPGLVLFLLASVAWPAAILLRFPETWDLWWIHTFGRFGEQCLNPRPWWYYFSTIPWQVLPWTLPALLAVPASMRSAFGQLQIADCRLQIENDGDPALQSEISNRQSSIDRFLWLWFLLPLAVLCLVKAKHHHYLIHSLPPCSFWAASGLIRLKSWVERLATWRRTVWLGWGVVAVSVATGIVYCYNAWPNYSRDAIFLGALLAGGTGVVVWACVRQRARLALVAVFAICWLGYGYVHAALMRKTDRYRDETAFLRRLNRPEHSGVRLLVFAYDPARVLLYCKAPAELCLSYHQVRMRYEEVPRAYLVTSMGQAEDFRGFADLTCVEKMQGRRWENLGPLAQLGAFRVEWRPPQNSAISAEASKHSP